MTPRVSAPFCWRGAGQQGISGFARLGNDDHQVAGTYDGVIVAIFRCHIHAHRNPCKPFDEVFAHGAGVHGCATGNYLDMAAVLKEVLRDFVPLEVGQTVLCMGNNGFAEGLGLFINLLEHEVVEAALLRLFHIPVGVAQLPGNRGRGCCHRYGSPPGRSPQCRRPPGHSSPWCT